MIFLETAVAVGVSFIFTLVALPYWISRSRAHNLLIQDAQKIPLQRVPYLAGLIVVFGAVLGILSYVFMQTFVYLGKDRITVLLAAVGTILIALIIGIIDDLLGERIGLRQYQKPILTLGAAIPMVVVNAGEKFMTFPFIGIVTLGNFYSFIIVPLGIIGATNGFNIVAGVNGLEAGMGIIILSTLGYVAWAAEGFSTAVIALCMVAALIPFLWYNRFPARILPGNGLTYAVGAAIAVVAIVGNLERAALLLFIPYFIEFFLKLRGRFQKESLARPLADGTLVNRYKHWYSLNHVTISLLRALKGKAREWEVTILLLVFELFIAGGVLFLYWK